MSKAKMFFIVGIWIAILPYLGFPITFKNVLFTLTGIIIIYISYTLYLKDNKLEKKGPEKFDNFSENKDFTKTD